MEIIAQTTMDAWKSALSVIMSHGKDFKDQEGRICREVLNMTIIVENPHQDIEEAITKMEKFDWIYPSREELKNIILSQEESGVYAYNYGPRIFNSTGKDQINDFIIPLLKENPTSRRAIITLYKPPVDSIPTNKHVPGLIDIYVKIEEGKLNLTGVIRSNDIFIGWPANMYQLHLVQEYIAQKLLIPRGSITTVSFSGHIFTEHMDRIHKIINN